MRCLACPSVLGRWVGLFENRAVSKAVSAMLLTASLHCQVRLLRDVRLLKRTCRTEERAIARVRGVDVRDVHAMYT